MINQTAQRVLSDARVLLASERSKGDVAALAEGHGIEGKYPSVLYKQIMNGGSDGTDCRAGNDCKFLAPTATSHFRASCRLVLCCMLLLFEVDSL